jgi:hypothetical protein
MAKHLTVDGVAPDAVTMAWLTRYFLAQVKGRKGAGAVTLYQNLRSFWLWFGDAYELPDPMAGIDRPEGKPALVQVTVPHPGPASRRSSRHAPVDRATGALLCVPCATTAPRPGIDPAQAVLPATGGTNSRWLAAL